MIIFSPDSNNLELIGQKVALKKIFRSLKPTNFNYDMQKSYTIWAEFHQAQFQTQVSYFSLTVKTKKVKVGGSHLLYLVG